MRTVVLAGMCAALWSSGATAAPCDAPKPGFDSVYCFAKIYMALDQQLNENYRALIAAIPSGQQSVLRDSQRGWISARDRKCYDFGTSSVNINCALDTTRQRVQFLSDRAAECRSVGCNIVRMSEF
jgi:uncharacterized protein YecT (DUF1311 family)